MSTEIKSCSCGCNSCGNKAPLLTEGMTFQQRISENLLYHINNEKPLTENTFRYGSTAFLDLWREARTLYSRNILSVGDEDEHILLETNLGEYGMFEGDRVPLDLPILDEGTFYSKEHIATYGDDEGNMANVYKNYNGKDFYVDTNEYDFDATNLHDLKEKLKGYGFIHWISGRLEEGNLEEISIKSNNVRDLIRRLYNDSKLVDFLQFKDFRNALRFIKNASLDEWYELMADVNTYEDTLTEAKYQGKEVALGKPKRGGAKKFYVYVMNPKTKKVKKVSFGDTSGLSAKINNPKARKAFADRHDCKNKKDKTKAGYWSCRLPRYASLLGLKGSYSGFW
jgi:hypothetical protein